MWSRPQPELAEPERADLDQYIDRLARAIVARSLTVPALLTVETGLPLSFLANQALAAFEPLAAGLVGPGYARLRRLLEDRVFLELLMRRVEQLESARSEDRATPVLAEQPAKGVGGQRGLERKVEGDDTLGMPSMLGQRVTSLDLQADKKGYE